METDYYLHNLDVEIGKEMKGYQKSFGVLEWNNDYATSTTDISVRRSRRSKNPNRNSIDTIIPDHSRRIAKVRDRCETQNRALSTWWKVALQVNVHNVCGCKLEIAHQNPCYLHDSKGYTSLKKWHNLIDSLPGLGLLQ